MQNQLPGENLRSAVEREILQVLTQYGAANARFVHNQLLQVHDIPYTAILGIMQSMVEKELLERRGGRQPILFSVKKMML